jgi:beta-N-acetylhexosaminidase
MALAATGSTETTERVYQATAEELRSAGINWAYSPVADVNSDPRNPVIGTHISFIRAVMKP